MCGWNIAFYHIEDDDTFISEVNNMDIHTQTLESLSELLFNPFELNTDDQYSPLYDIDPDVHFYNELDSHIGLKCNYYFEDMVSTAIEDNFKGRSYHSVFSICHMNIRSLKANLASFETCLENVDIPFTVIGISETWLRDCNCDLYNIMGYNLIETHRHNKMGGGVGIFLKSNISFQIRSDLGHHESYESVFVEIEKESFHKNRNLVVGVIYRPPGTDLKLFNEDINSLLNLLKNENKLCYLMGDYNINLLNYGKHSDTTEFVDILHGHSFISLINRPTRVKQQSATLIDNIFTNCYLNIENTFQCIIYTDITDHFPIIHVDYEMKEINADTYAIQRNLSQKNQIEFRKDMGSLDWGSVFNERDTQAAFSRFHGILLKLYNKHFPQRPVKLRYNSRKPWLTGGLKKAIKTNNKLYLKYRKIDSVKNEVSYKNYRNKLNHIMRISENKYFSDLLSVNKNNVKKNMANYEKYHKQKQK